MRAGSNRAPLNMTSWSASGIPVNDSSACCTASTLTPDAWHGAVSEAALHVPAHACLLELCGAMSHAAMRAQLHMAMPASSAP